MTVEEARNMVFGEACEWYWTVKGSVMSEQELLEAQAKTVLELQKPALK